MLVMGRHVASQILFPQELFAADITMEVSITDMLHHMHFQHDIVKEPHVTNRALDFFLPQMRPANVIMHE